ncbi:MAG: TAXI family TRAP transporter solute-binding subunit [Synergistetes bacterium]|nr:MAG: TRAP transporter solute receptor, TAXI family [bacterium 42_11]MBC7330980.1 TAXI family TRAP transporter solute-binding subunit [Synergistota bacterium]
MIKGKWIARVLTILAIIALVSSGLSLNATAKPKPPKPIMSVASGPAGSLYVNFCAAFAEALMKAFDGLQVNVEPGGSSQNMILVHRGEAEFGITATLQTYPGYYGFGWAKERYTKVASLIPAYSYQGVWFAPANSPVNSLQDLNGKVVGLGYAGGGSDVTGRQILEFFNIKPAKIVNASWSDTGGMLRDGLLDAVFYLAGHPAGFIQEVETQKELKFIEISDEEFKKFIEAYPYYTVGVLRAGTYKGIKKDLKVFQGWNFIICQPDLPEDFIYNVVKSIFEENLSIIHNAHSSFKQCNLENVQYMNLPLHPGAEKYYKEKGVKLPVLPPPPKK